MGPARRRLAGPMGDPVCRVGSVLAARWCCPQGQCGGASDSALAKPSLNTSPREARFRVDPSARTRGQRPQEQPCVSWGVAGTVSPSSRGDNGEGTLGLGCGPRVCPSLHKASVAAPLTRSGASSASSPFSWWQALGHPDLTAPRMRLPWGRAPPWLCGPGVCMGSKTCWPVSAGIGSELTLEPTALQGTRVSESAFI